MKRIIEGVLYDTGKANLIISFRRVVKRQNPLFRDLYYSEWVDAELYKTEKGTWFEVADGCIKPLDLAEAKKVLECNPDKYQEFFRDLIEA